MGSDEEIRKAMARERAVAEYEEKVKARAKAMREYEEKQCGVYRGNDTATRVYRNEHENAQRYVASLYVPPMQQQQQPQRQSRAAFLYEALQSFIFWRAMLNQGHRRR